MAVEPGFTIIDTEGRRGVFRRSTAHLLTARSLTKGNVCFERAAIEANLCFGIRARKDLGASYTQVGPIWATQAGHVPAVERLN